MTSTGSPTTAPAESPLQVRERLTRVVSASMAGTVVEWYEFFLYASAATLIFGKQFFPPGGSEYKGIIDAFLTYAVGFVARPLGGIVFGHFGDKFGRKHLLQVSIIMVGLSTFLMGCLPTFHQVGYLAPVLLVTLRFLQGFAVGGEWGGAILLVAEHSPNESRGFWASWPQAAVPLGNLLATGVLLGLSAALSQAQFLAWGWRVAFWLSAVIVLIGWYIRTKVTDAPIFQNAKQEQMAAASAGYGVAEVFRRYPRGVFTAMGLRLAENILYYLVVTFSITYLKVHLTMDTSRILMLLLVAHAAHFVMVPLIGRASDILGRRPVYATGAALAATWGFIAYPMFNTRDPLMILLAITVGLFIQGLMYAGQPAIMSEMFPTRMRYSGVSLGYQVTSLFAGSLAPIIATTLLDRYHSATPIAVYLAICSAITLTAVLFAKETRGISLDEVDRIDAEHMAADARPGRASAAVA